MRLARTPARSARLSRHPVVDVGHRRRGLPPTAALWVVLVLGLGAIGALLAAEPAHGSAVLAAGLASDSPTPTPTPTPTATPIPTPTPAPTPINVYRWTGVGMFSPTVASDPFRVY